MKVVDAVRDLLARTKGWLTTEQIAVRLGLQRKNVHRRLRELADVGIVETRPDGRDVQWRSRPTFH